MFEPAGGEVPAEGAAAGAPGAHDADGDSPESVAAGSPSEPNGVWAERDWTDVPVLPASDEPPPGWQPEQGWLDDLEHPQLGPVSWLEQVRPSARLMRELEELPADLVESDEDAVEMVAHWARLESYCALRKREAAAALARRVVMFDGLATLKSLGVRTGEPNIAGDELALRLGIGRRAAQTLVRSGRAFRGVGIPTAEALAAGEIDATKADLIVAGVEDLEPDAALDVQYEVLAKAPHVPSGRLRRALATACAAVDPAHYEQRCQAAAATRRVDRPRVLPDGMASLYAVMPAVETTQLYRAIDAAARAAKTVGDPRSLDQLRADALALMGTAAMQTGWIGACQRPHLDDAGTVGTFGAHDPTRAPGTAGPPRAVDPDHRDGEEVQGSPPQQVAPECVMRVGVIGGVSAHVRVVIPLTAAMGGLDRPGPGAGAGAGADGVHHNGAPENRASDDRPPDDPALDDPVPDDLVPDDPVPDDPAPDKSAPDNLGPASPALDDPAPDTGAHEPAQLEGYGPIPGSVACALAAGGPWARMVTDPLDRTVLEVSRDVYEPPPAMAALVRAREPECVHPACSASSDGCDLHHRIPWPVGLTSVTNLDPGCRRDHLLLTHGGWSYITDAEGRRTWTTAAGLVYVEGANGNLTRRKPKPQRSTEELPPHDDGPPPF